MDKKVALITGVEGIIGTEIVKSLARKDYAIALVCHNDFDKARSLERLCAVQGVETLLLSGDMNVSGICSKWVSDILTFFQRLDVLICNVGYNSNGDWFSKSDDAHFLRDAQDEINGIADLFQAVMQPMSHFKGGRIITTSLPRNFTSESRDQLLMSSIEGITKEMAKEYGKHNVTVNAVLPGVMELPNLSVDATDDLWFDIPIERKGSLSEFNEVVNFLLSETTGYVTGQTIAVDGGVRL